ncbi:DgyrCDS11856 [Dimorphilus gyrociliatus]|uniref:Aminopeptidase n=1 Tax=Dimorphilus gyrociliatus TaxID=2664684 RepID=A0A7I8W4Q4_9ANNE|nr:DgyrCDS11856 [Dimorphilus gyrociliatus]
MSQKKPFERLPKDVVPENYVLELTPHLSNFTFDGKQEIAIEVKNETSSITMNSCDIEIKDVWFECNGLSIKSGIRTTLNNEEETVKFEFDSKLPKGRGKLGMTFIGQLNDKLKGFYRNKYFTSSGEERYGAVTQFESTDARRAFPCWDEPAVKATFEVQMTVPKDLVALSNMPEKHCEVGEKTKTIQYEKTPVMSTYLLAFIVGEYDKIEAKDEDGVLVRVFTPVGKSEQGKYALNVAVKTLPFYKKYFNISYPLPKIDLIAIDDFAAGAMENWGLVTYRETALLIDPVNSSSASKQWVALVVGHELAHQWFGNLVTMEWWTDLWLNEGFASWIEYLCVDHCFPDFDIWTQFASNDFSKALDLDALKSSHPIQVEVGHPAEVDEIFDAISYCKGASVIRMLNDYIGDEHFRTGLYNYLTKHKYENTVTADLWKALGDASGKPVDQIMSTYTKQMGFPIISVDEKREGSKRILHLKQSKFTADGSTDDSKWLVPINIGSSSSSKPIHQFVLEEKETVITLDNVSPDDWIKLNMGHVGFYRVQYSESMLNALLPSIKSMTLSARDRLGLQNDAFALARAGAISTVDALKIASAYQNETNYTVWNDLSTNLSSVSLLLQYTDYHDLMKAFTRKLYNPICDSLGWDSVEGEGHLTSMLRSLVIGKLGRAGEPKVIAEAKRRFKLHCSSDTKMAADLRKAVYTTVLTDGTSEVMDAMMKLFNDADMHEEKERIMRSLGAVSSPELIDRVLNFSISKDVRSQDTVFVIRGTGGSVVGREGAWNFIKNNWKKLYEMYEGGFLLNHLARVPESFADEDKVADVKKFFEVNGAPSIKRSVDQSIENILLNKAQLARDNDALKKYLESEL